MNDQMKNTNPNDIEKKLLDVAGRTNANPHFVSELEAKLKDSHKPITSWSMPLFKQTSSALGWIALVIVVGYFLNWSFATLIPTQQPGANTTPNQFICPVTEPNGNTPPFEQPSTYHHGNGEIWTDLWPEGKIYMQPANREADGSLSMKWVWWRNATGILDIQGQRLDANAEPLRVFYTGGYDDTGVYVVALIFPTTGCWEVTAKTGAASLTFVTEVVFGEATPTPELSTTQNTTTSENATPVPEDGGYVWRDTKMYLAQPLPQSPIEAQVYSLKLNQPVTKDDVLVLAQRFGIQGEVQELPPDFSNSTGYMLTDGTQKLEVQSNNYFVFYPNYTAAALGTVPEEQVRTVIDGFLKKYDFDFEYHVESAPGVSGQQYTIKPLTPDGAEIRSDFIMPVGYQVTIDGTGQILAFSGYLLNHEPIGTYPIITAEEAFQDAIADLPQFGRIESFLGKNGGGGGGGPGFYKLNLSGTPVPFPTTTAKTKVFLGSTDYIVTEKDTLASIASSFGISLAQLAQANDLSSENIISVGQKLIIPSTPQDTANYIYTVVAGDTCRSIASTFNISIEDLITNNNLPADCSTLSIDQVLVIPNVQISAVQEMSIPYTQPIQLEIGQRIEGERGIFQVNIYEESQRIEYAFFGTTPENSDLPYMILEGSDLQSMQKYNNLPINLWGTVTGFGRNEAVVVEIDRYEIPFPDLDFQIIEGTQKMMEIDGKTVLTFTTDDETTYVQIASLAVPLDEHYISGKEGDRVLLEVLIIPDEIYKGYPTLHMYSGNLAVDPISGKTNKLKITANQFNTYNEPSLTTEVNTPPTATIEKVELVYYLPNLWYGNTNPNADAKDMQPAWRFYGHYSTGDQLEIFVQALKQEFLLPELAPIIPPG
jgi:LysM repeat protein